jgi:dTDP-4-amino-4,6-dideoxygalactose transaminase
MDLRLWIPGKMKKLTGDKLLCCSMRLKKMGIAPYFSTITNISPYWIVEFDDEYTREKAARHLKLSKIDSRLWWEKGCHLMPAFKSIFYGDFPNTEAVANRILGLPKYRDLNKTNIDLIGEILHTTLTK